MGVEPRQGQVAALLTAPAAGPSPQWVGWLIDRIGGTVAPCRRHGASGSSHEALRRGVGDMGQVQEVVEGLFQAEPSAPRIEESIDLWSDAPVVDLVED